MCALLGYLSEAEAINLTNKSKDEVDDLMAKQDEKDAQEAKDKEFNDASSKMNQIGNVSRQHSAAEDEDYLQTVFTQYATQGTDKRGKKTGVDVLTKEKAFDACQDIIMKWNDLPEQNAKKYLDQRYDKTWKKFDVNNQGFIDVTEAFQFVRQLMGTFTTLTSEVEQSAAQVDSNDAQTNELMSSLGL